MTKGKKKLLKYLGVFVGLIIIYFLNYPAYYWNQKLTVELETPDGVISGASVVRSIVSYQPSLGIATGASRSWRGEATIVVLPNEKYLFVLLGDPIAMAQHSFFEAIHGDADARIGESKPYFSKLKNLRESTPLLRERYPLFVTFDDLNDAASVKQVDPDDLAATFGEDYALKSVTLEITDEEVMEGRLVKLLPWLSEYLNQRLDGSHFESVKAKNRFANSLGAGSFKVGD